MQFTIETYYRLELLPPVVAFVAETARCLGATSKEVSELSMAVEEAAAYIIERYPNDGLDEQFEVLCEVQEDGLRVVLRNMGLPVDPLRLPKYEVDQPEETIEGLGLFLIEKLVDHFELVNRGRDGWRSVLMKRFDQPRLPESIQAAVGEEGAAPRREKLQILPAGIEHVPGIVELAYRNYGYSYSKELFYYADQLERAILDGRVNAFVALTPEGRVVGQMALLQSPESPQVSELGALMVQPEYRKSMGLLQLIKAVVRATKKQEGAPQVGEANLVTTHTQSQKVCSLFNFCPMALKLSVHGRARFLDLAEESDEQRETLLHAVTLTRPLERPAPLFVPPAHLEMTQRLFANANLAFETPDPAPAVPEQGALTREVHTDSGLAILSLHPPGADFAAVLRQQLFELESDGLKTVFVRLPGWLPLPQTLEQEARSLRLFFSGWVVEAPERWWLLYTRLFAQRFDFSRIQLVDPVAIELQAYIDQCFQEAVFS